MTYLNDKPSCYSCRYYIKGVREVGKCTKKETYVYDSSHCCLFRSKEINRLHL